MTDKLIEHAKRALEAYESDWALASDLDEIAPDIARAFINQAEALKAADEMSRAFDALICAHDYPDMDAGELIMSSVRATLATYRKTRENNDDIS